MSKINTQSFLLTKLALSAFFIFSIILFSAFTLNGDHPLSKTPDTINMFSGKYSLQRIDDSTFICKGSFTITSGSKNTSIKANKLKVSNSISASKNHFSNDNLHGDVFVEGVEICTKKSLVNKSVSFSADEVKYSNDSLTIKLSGKASVTNEDLRISSNLITLHLSEE